MRKGSGSPIVQDMDSNLALLCSNAPVLSLAVPDIPKSRVSLVQALQRGTGGGEDRGEGRISRSLPQSCSQPHTGSRALSARLASLGAWVSAFSALHSSHGCHPQIPLTALTCCRDACSLCPCWFVLVS